MRAANPSDTPHTNPRPLSERTLSFNSFAPSPSEAAVLIALRKSLSLGAGKVTYTMDSLGRSGVARYGTRGGGRYTKSRTFKGSCLKICSIIR